MNMKVRLIGHPTAATHLLAAEVATAEEAAAGHEARGKDAHDGDRVAEFGGGEANVGR